MRRPSPDRRLLQCLKRMRQVLASRARSLRDGGVLTWRDGWPQRSVALHPEWAIAVSVPISAYAAGSPGDTPGTVIARRHPTGWFIAASHGADMSAEDLADFRHFVCVRVYLLLRHGPRAAAWAHDEAREQWRATRPAVTLGDSHLLEGVLESWKNPSPPGQRPIGESRLLDRVPSRAEDGPVPRPRARPA